MSIRPHGSYAVMNEQHDRKDEIHDYPTPLWATRALCEYLKDLGFPLQYLTAGDPACGRGHMALALKEYFKDVWASDKYDYGYGFAPSDFLENTVAEVDWIITNPPFRLGLDFCLRALGQARVGVAMFTRTAFLESTGRYRRIFSDLPPRFVLQFTERVPLFRGRLSKTGSTATSYCWLVWLKSKRRHQTTFDWIPPCRLRLERDSDNER